MDTMFRNQFENLPPEERLKAARMHRIIDAPPKAPEPVTDETVLTRKEFESLSPKQRMAAMLAGRRVVDGVRADAA